MKCQNCGKYEAIVDYTQVIDGNKLHLHLCDRCAKEMKIGMEFAFDIDDVFSTFFNGFPSMQISDKLDVIKCKTCNSTYNDFKNTGKLGCPDCYETFERELDNVLKRLHGSNRHIENNKKAKSKETEKTIIEKIDDLKEQLKECIKTEEYEKAAKLRDKIKELENKRGENK